MNLEMISPLEVGIACRDLPRLRQFYETAMGCRFISEFVVPADKSAASAMSRDGYTVVRLQTSYGERIKLLSPTTVSPAPAPADYIVERPNAMYLTFIVRDIDSAIASLQKEGASFMTGPSRVEVRPGVYLAFCRDPEGNVLELVEYADISSYRTDLNVKE